MTPAPPPWPSVFFYVSGHGFGHASRQIEVINALGALRPDITDRRPDVRGALAVRSHGARPGHAARRRVRHGRRPDRQPPARRGADDPQRAAPSTGPCPIARAREAALASRARCALVVADAPPLGCAAAAAPACRPLSSRNFTWDWIYEAYAGARAPRRTSSRRSGTAYRERGRVAAADARRLRDVRHDRRRAVRRAARARTRART